jgi:3-dehydroquinate synthase
MPDPAWLRLAVTHPGGSYDVVIGHGLLPELTGLAGILGPVAIVTDDNVGPLYLGQCGNADCVVTIPAGEGSKTLETVHGIYDQLLAAGIDRAATIVALGGGVVGDVAGFVAATFMRGVDFVQCPTSLLAMVDASIGGKTGVDLPQGKNLVGAFKQPSIVIADLATLHTLPAPEFAGGMAEVVKHGLIADPAILDRLERDPLQLRPGDVASSSALSTLVADAIRVKRDIVQEDPFEGGRRAVLNLGHTFAHAVEQISHYQVGHGRAVAMGLVAATHLSISLDFAAHPLQQRIEALLNRLNLPTRIPAVLSPEALLQAMSSDKKRAAGQRRLVLLRSIGNPFVTGDVTESQILRALAALRAPDGERW